jgi:hypothetical protein
MGFQDSMNLYQAFGMNPVNYRDPFGLSHVEPSIVPCYLAAKKDNPAIARIYERVSTVAMMAIAGGVVAKIVGLKIFISAMLTWNITSTLDETVERRKAGQTPEQVNRAAVAKLLMFGPFYKIIKGKEYGTQVKVSPEDRVATAGELLVGTIGFTFGYNAVSSNPSTFQLMDDTFKVLDFKRTSTGGYVVVYEDSAIGGASPVKQGQYGESVGSELTGLPKNTKRIPSASGKAKYRIPDHMDDTGRFIAEDKAVNYQYLSTQFLDYKSYVMREGGPGKVLIIIDENTVISVPLLKEHLNVGSPIKLIKGPLKKKK